MEEMTPKPLKLFKKLLEVRKSVDYLKKAAQGSQFSYTSSSQVLSAVREKMNELGLLLVTHVTNHHLIEKETGTVDKSRTTYFTELDIFMEWVDTESGETYTIPWYGQGVDLAGEKGVGKALTYAEKYFILKQFNIPTDKDDPDAFQEKSAASTAGSQNSASVAERIAEKINNLVLTLETAQTVETVTSIWTNNIDLQSNAVFVAAIKKAGERLTAKK